MYVEVRGWAEDGKETVKEEVKGALKFVNGCWRGGGGGVSKHFSKGPEDEETNTG